jgi:hypothetical protein
MPHIGRFAFLLLFLVLFTIQISGLSCLEEWTITPSSSTLSQETSTLDDDCPCHFTFVSSPSLNVYWNGLVTRAAIDAATDFPLWYGGAEIFGFAFRPVRVHLDAIQVRPCTGKIWSRDELMVSTR